VFQLLDNYLNTQTDFFTSLKQFSEQTVGIKKTSSLPGFRHWNSPSDINWIGVYLEGHRLLVTYLQSCQKYWSDSQTQNQSLRTET